jgi:hypothetical protein
MALDPQQILRKNLGKMENNIKTKLQRFGAWSEELAKYRLQLHFDHPMAINAFKPMMSGIEFNFPSLGQASTTTAPYNVPYNVPYSSG